MRQANGYLLKYIGQVPFLLPYGQNIADQRRSIQLNETGVFLWNLLKKEQPFEELFTEFCQFYQASEDDIPVLKKDLQDFLSPLLALGILEDKYVSGEPFYKTLQIGGLTVRFYGQEEFFSSQFDKFQTDFSESRHPDLCVHVHHTLPPVKKNGEILLRNSELWVIRTEEEFLLLFPSLKQIREAHISPDGREAHIYCTCAGREEVQEELFHTIRHIYLYCAQFHGVFALHSASVLYEGKAWLFSGHSGMGKSTHTALWQEHFHTPILNGDLNLLAMEDQKPVVHGLPWCGTSGICTEKSYPLGGIILLKRGQIDHMEALTDADQALLVMQRLISPTWTADLAEHCIDFTEQLTREILTARLCCTKELSAASCCRQAIDAYLHRSQQSTERVSTCQTHSNTSANA